MSEPVTAIERLEALLNEKDEQIESLEEDVRKAEQRADQAEAGWTMHIDLGKVEEQALPLPRLEMVFEPDEDRGWAEYKAVYRLVYRHFIEGAQGVPLGLTTIRGGRGEPPIRFGKIDLPFRDGVHIAHDAAHLNLPAFAILGERIERIPSGWWSCQCPACRAIAATSARMSGEDDEQHAKRVAHLAP